MSSHYETEKPVKVTINKMLAHKDTRLGSRLWQRGAYYTVVDEGGSGVGEHWILKIDENQDHVAPPK